LQTVRHIIQHLETMHVIATNMTALLRNDSFSTPAEPSQNRLLQEKKKPHSHTQHLQSLCTIEHEMVAPLPHGGHLDVALHRSSLYLKITMPCAIPRHAWLLL